MEQQLKVLLNNEFVFKGVDKMNEDYKIQCPICGKEFNREDMDFTHDCHGVTYRLVCLDCYDDVMEDGYDGECYSESDECLDDDY